MNVILDFLSNDLIEDLLSGLILSDLEIMYFGFFTAMFQFMKYTFVVIIIVVGLLTLTRLRGVYIQQRGKGILKEEDQLGKVRLIVGTLYICFGFGILFNYLIYFLIWILSSLPKGLVYSLIEIGSRYIPENYLFLRDRLLIYMHPIIAFASFLGIIYFFLSLYYLINNNRVISNLPKIFRLLIKSIVMIIFLGFSTSFPYLV